MQRDKLLAKNILLSINEKEWLGSEDEWSPTLFLTSTFNTSDADLFSIEIHFLLLEEHGCFTSYEGMLKFHDRHYEYHLSWTGYDLLEQLSSEPRF